MSWSLNQLKQELEKREANKAILQWSILRTHLQRRENYLIQEKEGHDFGVGLDQDREVEKDSFRVTVATPKTDSEKQGRASADFSTGEDISPQLDQLLQTSDLSEEKRWEFPEPSKRAQVKPETCYTPFSKDLGKITDALLEDLNAGIASPNISHFNSAELFSICETENLYLSSGFESEMKRSKIYGEVCFSHKNSQGESEEFLCTEWNCHPEQFNFEKMCLESAENARNSLNVEKPESGTYSVLLHKDVLGEVFNAAVSHFSSFAEYYKSPFKPLGSEFVPGFEGEKFEMSLDPSMNFLMGSQAFSAEGLAQKPLLLVSNNEVIENLTSAQFSQYLDKPVTSTLGNVVIDAKGKSVETLRASDDQVLEILQFSGLFVNPMTLTFSSEIRLAKLHNASTGRVTDIKGGSLSGNLMQNLRNVKWSKEKATHNHMSFGGQQTGYSGPAFALFSNVSVSS